MDEPSIPSIIYQTHPYHISTPTPPYPLTPNPLYAQEAGQVTATGTVHGPAAWPPMPAPDLGYCLAPAYFILPYSYAYPYAPLIPSMPQLHAAPLLSRIQLNNSTVRWEEQEHPRHDVRGRGRRKDRAADAAARASAWASQHSRRPSDTPYAGRSASPRSRRPAADQEETGSSQRSGSPHAIPLLARLSSPQRPRACLPLADRLSDEYASDTTRAESRRPQLAERLSSPPPDPATPGDWQSEYPAPGRAQSVQRDWSAPGYSRSAPRLQQGVLRAVRDDHNFTCLTSLPIRSGEEVRQYLSFAFESDDTTPACRLPYESSDGPAPPLRSARLRAVPPGATLLHENWAPLRLALWKRYGPQCISRLMTLSADEAVEEARSLSEWSRALRPGRNAREVLGLDPANWTDEVLFSVGLFPASERESKDMVWENDTFLFRADVEQLAARLHKGLRAAPLHARDKYWAGVRDAVRRVWGQDLTYFPDARETAYLDSADELVRLRHWRALARIMEQWELPDHLAERVHLATGGAVRALESDLQEILRELGLRELRRETHPFPYRRIDA